MDLTIKVRRSLARYVLMLRISAAAALPTIEPSQVIVPAPVVRSFPGQMRGQWDEREIIQGRGVEWIVTRSTAASALESTISLN